jgi:hypothetical protein
LKKINGTYYQSVSNLWEAEQVLNREGKVKIGNRDRLLTDSHFSVSFSSDILGWDFQRV